jgi:hypothetical protein
MEKRYIEEFNSINNFIWYFFEFQPEVFIDRVFRNVKHLQSFQRTKEWVTKNHPELLL